ncbi:MAG: hypothetical protein HPPSJP_5010 [Candidatus Hepatoplasma scabrum]|nr:MAG: hypothetical protein HPPSJP_5010 [Candidatus Hepatoplasma sp.]
MVKILIPKNNAYWFSDDNIEKHAISFPGESKDESLKKRDEFINYVIFDDQFDFKNLDNGYWIEKDLIINNTYQATLKLNINDYLLEEDFNQKQERISNLNYIIINQNNSFKFYFVSKIEWLNNEEFIIMINLDIYTTYPISTILDGDAMIDRAHLKRTDLDKLQIREDFSFELSKVEKIPVDFKYGDNIISNSIIWIIGLCKEETPTTKIGTLPLNYDYYLYPIYKTNGQENGDSIKIMINDIETKNALFNDTGLTSGGETEDKFVGFYLLESPLYPNAINIKRVNSSDSNSDFIITLSNIDENNFELRGGKLFIKRFDLDREMGWSDGISIHDFSLQSNSYLSYKNVIFEHKLYLAPYQVYKIETTNGESSIDYDPLQLGWNNALRKDHLRFNFSLNPLIHTSSIYFEKFSSQIEIDPNWNINQYSIIKDNEYPKRTISYLNVLKDAKSEAYSQMLNKKKFPQIANVLEKRKISKYMNNLKYDNSSKINGDLFISYLLNNETYSWKLNKYSLNIEEEKSLWDYFHKYGYKLNKTENIKNYLNSRFWFNYLKATDIFKSVDRNLSEEIKLKIDKDFTSGIFFWHYRNKRIWNGINNYELENAEIDFIQKNPLDEVIGTIKEFINNYDPNLNDKYLGTWIKLHEYNQNFTEGMTTIQAITSQLNTISSGNVKCHKHKLAESYVGSNNKSEGINDDSDVVGYIDGYDLEENIIRIGQSHHEVGKLIPYSSKNSSEQNNISAGLFTTKWVRIK